MNAFHKIKTFILDTLFPISCLSCGKDNDWLCAPCLAKIPLKTEHVCPLCEKTPTPDGRACFACRPKTALAALLVASSYQEKIVSSTVHFFKYRFVQELHQPLGEILTRSLLASQLPLPDFILPVPLHRRRLRWRGFNQAELLARHLATHLTPGFPIPVLTDFLLRQRFTRPQMEIKNYFQRRKNITNAFAINNKSVLASGDINASLYRSAAIPIRQSINLNDKNSQSINKIATVVRGELPRNDNVLKNKTILLVDDIATTGSTLFECAKVLRAAGAHSVCAAVIARQETKK